MTENVNERCENMALQIWLQYVELPANYCFSQIRIYLILSLSYSNIRIYSIYSFVSTDQSLYSLKE